MRIREGARQISNPIKGFPFSGRSASHGRADPPLTVTGRLRPKLGPINESISVSAHPDNDWPSMREELG